MKQIQAGSENKLYKIYIWGGLALVVIFIIVSVLVIDTLSLPGPTIFIVAAAPLFLWFAGIMLYWWWILLYKSNQDFEKLIHAQDTSFPDINSLKSLSTLHQAMSISGGNPDELIRNEKKANRPIILWYACLNLLAVWICGFITLGSLEIIKSNNVQPLLYGVFIWIGVMLFATPLIFGWGRKTAASVYLKPLGLDIVRAPSLKPDMMGILAGGQKLIPDGPAIAEGERCGRLVHIETIDKHSLTFVQANPPEFKVQSIEGKLTPDEPAPEAVLDALKDLRKAKRWRGIEVHSGSGGIAVQRESKGTNMWLYDLWLAEYLLDKIGAV